MMGANIMAVEFGKEKAGREINFQWVGPKLSLRQENFELAIGAPKRKRESEKKLANLGVILSTYM